MTYLCVLVVLRTTLRFSDILGLTKLRNALLIILIIYYSKRIQIKVSKGKGAQSAVQEKPGTFPGVLSQRSNMDGV